MPWGIREGSSEEFGQAPSGSIEALKVDKLIGSLLK